MISVCVTHQNIQENWSSPVGVGQATISTKTEVGLVLHGRKREQGENASWLIESGATLTIGIDRQMVPGVPLAVVVR